jgi:hypothetical protein
LEPGFSLRPLLLEKALQISSKKAHGRPFQQRFATNS